MSGAVEAVHVVPDHKSMENTTITEQLTDDELMAPMVLAEGSPPYVWRNGIYSPTWHVVRGAPRETDDSKMLCGRDYGAHWTTEATTTRGFVCRVTNGDVCRTCLRVWKSNRGN